MIRAPRTERKCVSRVVLHVDDNEINRYTRTVHLRRAGFDVVEGATGAQALALASSHSPALVVLDIRLPDLNGFEVCRRLKDSPATASIPVLQISAIGRAEHDYPEALESGADAYLREPVEAELLIAAVNALLRASAAEVERDNAAREARRSSERLELAQTAGKHRCIRVALPDR